jgi:hypothetical protein
MNAVFFAHKVLVKKIKMQWLLESPFFSKKLTAVIPGHDDAFVFKKI